MTVYFNEVGVTAEVRSRSCAGPTSKVIRGLASAVRSAMLHMSGLGAHVLPGRARRREMTESIGADIGTRILQAVEGLGLRMDRLEARMDRLEARMAKVESEVSDLKTRMAKQEHLMEMLGAEFLKSRDALQGDIQQLRTDMNEGFRRLSARIDLTDSVVILMAKELRRPRELSEELQTNLRHIEAR